MNKAPLSSKIQDKRVLIPALRRFYNEMKEETVMAYSNVDNRSVSGIISGLIELPSYIPYKLIKTILDVKKEVRIKIDNSNNQK